MTDENLSKVVRGIKCSECYESILQLRNIIDYEIKYIFVYQCAICGAVYFYG